MAQADDLGLVVNDIVSLTKSGTGAPGTVDTYTFTLRDGKTFSFQVTNGANGGTGGVEKHEFTTVSDFTDWYLTIDLSMLISVAFFDADYNSMLCYIDNSGANTKLYKTLPNGVMQELSALSTGEKIVAFLKVDETLEFVPVTREIAGINLENNITENALFDKMNIKGRYVTLTALQTANPNHGYCYLVEENNHWYYWNNNAWTDGGEYKGNKIADNSIDGNKLTNLLISNISNLEIPYKEQNGFLDSNGIYSNPSTYHSKTTFKIKCKEGDKFLYKGVGRALSVSALFYQGTTILSSIQYNNISVYNLITIPENCDNVVFSSFDNIGSEVVLEVYKLNDLTKYIYSNNYRLKSDGKFIDKIERNGYLISSGSYNDRTNYHSLNIKTLCSPGEKYFYKGIGRGISVSALFYQGTTILSSVQYNTPYSYVLITIPENCDNVVFSSFDNIGSEVVLEVISTNEKNAEIYEKVENNSVLSGKKWYAYGDSFTHGDFTGLSPASLYTFSTGKYRNRYKVYPFYIGNRTNCEVYNQAQNGLQLKQFIDNETYKTISLDSDYLTFYFGINDSHNNVPIGTINDTTSDTFYGCWNILINWLFTNVPNAKIGIIISNGCETTDYPIATINIAEKYGISYLDINGDKKLPMVIRANMRGLSTDVYNYWYNKYRVTETNGHPNVQAHEDESHMIQQWLERL